MSHYGYNKEREMMKFRDDNGAITITDKCVVCI